MANWRDEMEHLGLDLRDGGRSLLDLRFADDILIFGTDYHVIGVLLNKLVENLAAVGLQLNAQKTKVLTTRAPPPSQLQTPNGQVRSGLHASGEPVLGRRRKKHNMYTTAVYMRQKLTNEGKCEFHTTSSTSLHDPRFAYLQYA